MMKRTVTIFLFALIALTALAIVPDVRARQDTPETVFPGGINPLTGETADDPELLRKVPALVPISRYPDEARPSAGLSFAAWIFEFYDMGGISRLFALFYGRLPSASTGVDPYIGSLGGALYGVEDLRNHYGALLISAGNRRAVVDDGLYNVQSWYGESGKDLYPKLPVSTYESFLTRWTAKIQPPDPELLRLPFSYGPPGSGLPAESLLVRYAPANQTLWTYDRAAGLYTHSQNSVGNPEILPTTDALTERQLSFQNVVLLFHDTERMSDGFKPVLNFIDRRPAIVFRDGLRYDVYWTTRSGTAENATDRFRPIRFVFENGEPFPLKPGQTWVHLVRMGNELREVESASDLSARAGSGNWFLPYIEAKR